MPQRSQSSHDDVKAQARELAQHCLAVRVRLLARRVTGIYESQIRESKLTIGQMNMLAATISLGPDQASASLLGKVLCMEKSTVSRNLDKMEAHQWVRRHAPKHGRRETLSVTSRGRRVFSKAYGGWSDAQQKTHQDLGPELVDALLKAFPLGAT